MVVANTRTCTLLCVRRVRNCRRSKHSCRMPGTVVTEGCSSWASGRIHCTAVNMIQKVVLHRSRSPLLGPFVSLRLITCQGSWGSIPLGRPLPLVVKPCSRGRCKWGCKGNMVCVVSQPPATPEHGPFASLQRSVGY